MRKYWSAAPDGVVVGKYFLPGPCLRSSRPDRLREHHCSERFRQCRTPAQEDKVCICTMSHSEVIEKISSHFAELMIAKIESMTESWQKPRIFGQGILPYNIVSGRNYTGANILTLLMLTEVKGYQSPVFVTFKQAKELGLQVRKGSRLFPVVFWKPFYLAITPAEGKPHYLSVEDFKKLPAGASSESSPVVACRSYSRSLPTPRIRHRAISSANSYASGGLSGKSSTLRTRESRFSTERSRSSKLRLPASTRDW